MIWYVEKKGKSYDKQNVFTSESQQRILRPITVGPLKEEDFKLSAC